MNEKMSEAMDLAAKEMLRKMKDKEPKSNRPKNLSEEDYQKLRREYFGFIRPVTLSNRSECKKNRRSLTTVKGSNYTPPKKKRRK